MIKPSNNRNDWFDSSSGDSKSSFQEHNERMRGFRRSHADVAMVNALRCDEPALLESTQPWQVSRIIIETGGSAPLNGTTDWSALIPVPKVARYKLSQN